MFSFRGAEVADFAESIPDLENMLTVLLFVVAHRSPFAATRVRLICSDPFYQVLDIFPRSGLDSVSARTEVFDLQRILEFVHYFLSLFENRFLTMPRTQFSQR